jgi:NADH:ubiquinone oxidoreductase subunit 3 (subunit A)
MTDSMDDETLDFTSDVPSSSEDGSLEIGEPYDPRPQEDEARRVIAYLLIGLLWVIVAGTFILIACGTISLENIKEFGVILGPVVTLVSAATGFYYGTKSSTNSS